MANVLKFELQEGVALLSLNNGALNILSQKLRAALAERLTQLSEDDGVKAVVLTGSSNTFSIGLDLTDLENDQQTPALSEICLQIEGFTKPIVAAISGLCMDGGLELALACHARVANETTQAGFSGLALGLLPVSGGTQLLPRFVGAENSIKILRAGQPIGAKSPLISGLFDRVVGGDTVEPALQLALRLCDQPEEIIRSANRRDGFADAGAYQEAIAEARKGFGSRYAPTEEKMIDALEAALLLPFEAGLAFEQEVALECRESNYSQGLRHVMQAQRRAPNIPEALQAKPRKLSVIGVVGGGSTAIGVAALALAKGFRVVLFERSVEAAEAAVNHVQALMVRLVGNPQQRQAALEKLTSTSQLSDLAPADLIFEAVGETLTTKTKVFAALDQLAGDETLLVTNAGLLSVEDIARVTKRPEHVIGLHFHVPQPQVNLVELLPIEANSAETVVTVAGFAKSLGRTMVRTGTGGGALSEAMLCALRDVAWFNIMQGATPYEVDSALMDLGMPTGVFMAMDRVGLDVVLTRLERLHNHDTYPILHRELLQVMVESGRTGQAEGAGFYFWDEKGKPHEDPELAALMQEMGLERYDLKPQHIQINCIAALANQGAKLLRSGAALRPSDIDAVMCLGKGFPRYQGGPMKMADMIGLFPILQELRRCAAAAPEIFDPEPGIAGLVKNGESFAVLNKLGRNRRTLPE